MLSSDPSQVYNLHNAVPSQAPVLMIPSTYTEATMGSPLYSSPWSSGYGGQSGPYFNGKRDSVESGLGTRKCSHCSATSTPLWCRDPNTMKPLCNACGLYLQQRGQYIPQELIDADVDDEPSDDPSRGNGTGPKCSHCHTRNTSVWRRNPDGQCVCNACGVYQRLRGVPRPLSLNRKKALPQHFKRAASSRDAVPPISLSVNTRTVISQQQPSFDRCNVVAACQASKHLESKREEIHSILMDYNALARDREFV
jgi:hypothetical protein